MKHILLIFLFLNLSYISHGHIADSLIIYYRPFCSDYHFENTDINKLKDMDGVLKMIITDTNKIDYIYNKLLIKKRRSRVKAKKTYYLGCFIYKNNKEELLFTISNFKRLNYNNKTYYYDDTLLQFLFDDLKRDCWYW